MLKAIAIVGYKKSGKTTLAVNLIRELRTRGLRVGAAKYTHHHLDAAGTDTALMTQAGAITAGVSKDGGAVFWPSARRLPDLLPLLEADVLVSEGGKYQGWMPRVLCLREPAEAEKLAAGLCLGTFGPVRAPGLPDVGDVAALADLVLARGFALPGLDCHACGRPSCADLARDIVSNTATPADCLSSTGTIKITIDGHPLALGPFVDRLAASTIRGLLSELKGYTPGRIDITLE